METLFVLCCPSFRYDSMHSDDRLGRLAEPPRDECQKQGIEKFVFDIPFTFQSDQFRLLKVELRFQCIQFAALVFRFRA